MMTQFVVVRTSLCLRLCLSTNVRQRMSYTTWASAMYSAVQEGRVRGYTISFYGGFFSDWVGMCSIPRRKATLT